MRPGQRTRGDGVSVGEQPYRQAAITGVGFTELSKASGRSVLALAAEACRLAIADAGLRPHDIDGVVTYQYLADSVPAQAVALALGMGDLSHTLDSGLAGQAPCYLVAHAATMVGAGVARNIVVYRALNGRSGQRVGSARSSGEAADLRHAAGLTAYPQTIALWARRFMVDTGATEDDLAAVAMAQRAWAAHNERALRRSPLTLDDYHAAPFVAEPLRTVDCTTEVDGACALVVTSLEAARDAPHPAVGIEGAAYALGRGGGVDMADVLTWPDLSRNYTSLLADSLWSSAGIRPGDVDIAELYDCFSSVVLFALEGLGFAERGGAGDLVRSGATRPGGALPVNTNGGLLNEGYLHGMNTLVEAVVQLQGRAGARQVDGAEVGVVTSGALQDGSALVLVRR
jgi:acetyl-CoA acetyltransferase